MTPDEDENPVKDVPASPHVQPREIPETPFGTQETIETNSPSLSCTQGYLVAGDIANSRPDNSMNYIESATEKQVLPGGIAAAQEGGLDDASARTKEISGFTACQRAGILEEGGSLKVPATSLRLSAATSIDLAPFRQETISDETTENTPFVTRPKIPSQPLESHQEDPASRPPIVMGATEQVGHASPLTAIRPPPTDLVASAESSQLQPRTDFTLNEVRTPSDSDKVPISPRKEVFSARERSAFEESSIRRTNQDVAQPNVTGAGLGISSLGESLTHSNLNCGVEKVESLAPLVEHTESHMKYRMLTTVSRSDRPLSIELADIDTAPKTSQPEPNGRQGVCGASVMPSTPITDNSGSGGQLKCELDTRAAGPSPMSQKPQPLIDNRASRESTPTSKDDEILKSSIPSNLPTQPSPTGQSNDHTPLSNITASQTPPIRPSVANSRLAAQQATLAGLVAERDELLRTLSMLPNIAEHLPRGTDPTSLDEATALRAATTVTQRHIKLLHQYNEIRDVGMGLMGLIAESRGDRIKDVQEEFGIDAKD